MSEFNRIENAKAEVKCTIDSDVWQNAQKKAFNKLSKQLEVKGFRKGHVPESVCRKMISSQQIMIEAVDAVAQEALLSAVNEHSIQLIDRPELDIDTLTPESCILKFICPVKPEAKLGDYKSLEYKVEEVTVSDEEVMDEINKLLDRKSDLEVKEEGTVEDGDTAVIDFEGFKDGVPFEGGKGENYDLTIGSNTFIPGFEPQLIGMGVEETKEINVTFPESYGVEDLNGKEVVFKVTVHEIKTKVVPALDDGFAEGLGYDGVKNVDDLKKYYSDMIIRRKTSDAESKANNELMDALCDMTDVEIPEIMIKSEVDEMLNRYAYQFSSQGMTMEMFYQYTGNTEESMREQLREGAIRKIKMNLALEQVAKLENVEVSSEEIEAEFANIAQHYGLTVEEVKKNLLPGDVAYDIEQKKALELLKK